MNEDFFNPISAYNNYRLQNYGYNNPIQTNNLFNQMANWANQQNQNPNYTNPNNTNNDIFSRSWDSLGAMDKLRVGFGGLQSAFGIYSGLKQLSMAKKQFAFQKQAYENQWNMQKKQHNEAVLGRMAGKYNNRGTAQRMYDAFKVN